jgi:hypothetical protein
LFLAFLRTARYFREECVQSHCLAVWEESESRRHFSCHSRPRVLVPDAAGVYLIGDQAYKVLVESDTGTRHRKSLQQKFAVFRDYAGSRAYRQDRVRLPLVLVVTSRGDERVRDLAAAAVEAGAASSPASEPGCVVGAALTNRPVMTFLIANRTDLERHGLHRPVWLDAATGQRRCCFTGFGDVPKSARMRLDARVMLRRGSEQPQDGLV